jgi:hypothetical protein
VQREKESDKKQYNVETNYAQTIIKTPSLMLVNQHTAKDKNHIMKTMIRRQGDHEMQQ